MRRLGCRIAGILTCATSLLLVQGTPAVGQLVKPDYTIKVEFLIDVVARDEVSTGVGTGDVETALVAVLDDAFPFLNWAPGEVTDADDFGLRLTLRRRGQISPSALFLGYDAKVGGAWVAGWVAEACNPVWFSRLRPPSESGPFADELADHVRSHLIERVGLDSDTLEHAPGEMRCSAGSEMFDKFEQIITGRVPLATSLVVSGGRFDLSDSGLHDPRFSFAKSTLMTFQRTPGGDPIGSDLSGRDLAEPWIHVGSCRFAPRLARIEESLVPKFLDDGGELTRAELRDQTWAYLFVRRYVQAPSPSFRAFPEGQGTACFE